MEEPDDAAADEDPCAAVLVAVPEAVVGVGCFGAEEAVDDACVGKAACAVAEDLSVAEAPAAAAFAVVASVDCGCAAIDCDADWARVEVEAVEAGEGFGAGVRRVDLGAASGAGVVVDVVLDSFCCGVFEFRSPLDV